MNERIKELAEQATTIVEMAGPHGYASSYANLDREKFAELIVLEICDVFDKRAEPGTGFYEPHEPAEMIRAHFGVEE